MINWFSHSSLDVFGGFKKIYVDFQDSTKIYFGRRQLIEILISINLPPWEHVKWHRKFGQIGSPVLTFIGYKQTDRQTNYIYRLSIKAVVCQFICVVYSQWKLKIWIKNSVELNRVL